LKKLKLIKFDIIHPTEYLKKKQAEWADLDELSLEEYRNRLISLRSNYSDFYTYHLNNLGDWEAEEFFLLDPVFQKKVAEKLFGKKHYFLKRRKGFGGIRNRFSAKKWRDFLLDAYIEDFKPDVIFVRSQPIPSKFWQKYKNDTLLVSRLSARLPKNWHPEDWDLIYTDQPDFKTFFELHGVKSILNDQGFDQRIVDELKLRPSKYDTIFVGGLGTQNFLKRTEFLNAIAKDIPFTWWGYWWKYGSDGRTLEDFPNLQNSYQGFTSGLEMFQKYKDARIVVNDYVDTANGIGFNQRMFEAMGSGAFLLTRDAPNFKDHFPDNVFATYIDKDDFLSKREFYLNNPKERETIANNAQRFIAENYDYMGIAKDFQDDLKQQLKIKFPG